MHLLYLDDAGSASNRNERYLVLGGVAVYEAQAHWITRELDKLAASIDAENADAIEFHASEVFSGRTPPWDRIKKDQRKQVIKDVLGILSRAYESCCAFSCAIEKACYPGVDPMALAFEDLCLSRRVMRNVPERWGKSELTQFLELMEANSLPPSRGCRSGSRHWSESTKHSLLTPPTCFTNSRALA